MLEGNRSALRLTFATYWRPSGKDIHKRRDAKDADDWGVKPDEGNEVILSKELAERLRELRVERDLATPEDLQANALKTPAKKTPAPMKSDLPVPTPDPELSPPAPEPEAEGTLPKSGPVEDPQLKRAIEVLMEKLAE